MKATSNIGMNFKRDYQDMDPLKLASKKKSTI
jgi:hypothetical protein